MPAFNSMNQNKNITQPVSRASSVKNRAFDYSSFIDPRRVPIGARLRGGLRGVRGLRGFAGFAIFGFALAFTFAFALGFAGATGAAAQERVDNRRLVWSGASGGEWGGASWKISGSFLAYANTNPGSDVWHSGSDFGASPALDSIKFLGGDVAIFDGSNNSGGGSVGGGGGGGVGGSVGGGVVNIAAAGVVASDVIVSGAADYIFTGGGITARGGAVAAGSVQLSGTGAGLAAGAVAPAGRLVKLGAGSLTLANDSANYFEGGIWLAQGVLSVGNAAALGANNISVLRASLATSASIALPATVVDSQGTLLRAGSSLLGPVSLHVSAAAAGLDITGDVFLANQNLTFDIEGDTTVSGRITGISNQYGASGGTITKTGTGTLFLSGDKNWFYGTAKNYNAVSEGRVVLTSVGAIGTGAVDISPGAVLEFRGARGSMPQAFIGGGAVEITGGSDVVFNWFNGTLSDYDSMSGNATWQPASNVLGSITVSGRSRFTALASGTYSSVLGGAGSYVRVTEGSTLVVGREGISARGSGETRIPMTYAILANRIDLSGGSTLVLNPNAYLSAGALVVTDNSACAITFGASGVSRLRWQDGVDPASISISSDANAGADAGGAGAGGAGAGGAGASLRYVVPAGMKLVINEVPVPVSSQQSVPGDTSPSGWCREYVLVNQGANPLKDIALTLSAVAAVHDALSANLADELINPVTRRVPAKGRKWVNEAWARYIASRMRYDDVSVSTPGMTGGINHAVAGFDAIRVGRVLVGLHAGMGENNLDTTNDTNLSTKQRFIGVHAAQRFGKFYLAGSADTGRARTDSFRNEAGAQIRGQWDTTYQTFSAEAGATFTPREKWFLKPSAGVLYTSLNISNYYEYAPSPIMVGDFSDTCMQANFGVSVGRKLTVFKRDVSLDLALSRKHAIKTPRASLDTHYYDAPATPITLERGDYYRDATACNLSARMAVSKHTLVGLAAGYEAASGQKRVTGSVLAGYTW